MALPRSYRLIVTILILFVAGYALSAQPARDFSEQVFDFLHKVPSTDAPPVFTVGLGLHRYLPEESIEPRLIDHNPLNHVVKTSDGVFISLDGTGRVFRVTPDRSKKYRFVRLDSTHYIGYNFGSFVFSFRDTIFSLGGYGFWHYNGQLRYFRSNSSGWELMPVNRRVQVIWPDLAAFLDLRNDAVWYLHRTNHPEAFKEAGSDFQDKEENTVFRLDLNRKAWEKYGAITPEFMPLANQMLVIGATPWGPLVQVSPPAGFRTLLVDYAANKVYELTDQLRTKSIQAAISSKEGILNNSPVTQYHQDSLHILSVDGSHSSFRLTLADFRETDISVYEPAGDTLIPFGRSAWVTVGILLAGLTGGVVMSWVFFRRERPSENDEAAEPEVFTPWETRILKAFQSRPDQMLTVEEMDELLETTKRTKEVQNQRRSSITRSINHKYSLLTGDAENLIVSKRQEMDRRMVQYYFSAEKFKAIRHVAGNGGANGHRPVQEG